MDLRSTRSVPVEDLDAAHHHSVRLLEAIGMLERSDGREFANDLLLDRSVGTDLLEEAILLLLIRSAQDSKRVDLVEEQIGHRGGLLTRRSYGLVGHVERE